MVTLVTTAAVSPLFASAPRQPLVPDQFGGNPPVASASASAPATGSQPAEPTASDDTPPIFAVGDVIPLLDSNGTVGDVTVLGSDAQDVPSRSGVIVLVEVRYSAARDLVVDPTAWVALSADGETTGEPPPAGKPPLTAGALKAGESRSGWLAFEVRQAPDTLLLDYRFFGSTLFSVQLY
jgi:hypothetical protein